MVPLQKLKIWYEKQILIKSHKETTNCKCERCFKREKRVIIRMNKKRYDP